MELRIVEEDPLPQPYRFINKIVLRCVDEAMTAIHDATSGKVSTTAEYRDSVRMPLVASSGSIKMPPAATCIEMVGKDILVGTSDATVTIYSSLLLLAGLTSPPLDCGPVTHVTGTTNFEGYLTIAALGPKGVVVFAYVPVDNAATGRKSFTRASLSKSPLDPLTGIGAEPTAAVEYEVFTVLGFAPLPVKDGGILGLDLAIDGRFMTITTATAAYHYSVNGDVPVKVPPPALKGTTRPPPPILDKPLQTHAAPDERLHSSLGFVRPVVSYVHHSAATVTGQPSDSLRQQPMTYAVYVTWIGTTCFTTSTLVSANPYVAPFLARAQEMVSQRPARRPETSESHVKGGAAKPDAKKAPAASAAAAAAIGGGGADLCPLPFEDIQHSLRYNTLPNFACAVAISKTSQTIAFACAEGVTWVWDTRLCCVVASVQLARYRARYMNHRAMMPSFVSLYNDTKVVVTQCVVGGPTTTVCCDIATGEELSRVAGWPEVVAGRTHQGLSCSVLMCGDDKTRVVDLASGVSIAGLTLPGAAPPSPRVIAFDKPKLTGAAAVKAPASRPPSSGTNVSISEEVFRSPEGSPESASLTGPRTLKEALRRTYATDGRPNVWCHENTIITTSDHQTLHVFSCTAIFSAAYPVVAPSLFGYEQLTALADLIPHHMRDASGGGGSMKATPLLTRQISEKAPPSRKPSLARKASVASLGGGKSSMHSLHQTPATFGGDATNHSDYAKYLVDVREMGRNARKARMKAKLLEWKMGAP